MRPETRPDRGVIMAALGRVVLAGACWALAAVLAKYAFERGVPPVRLAEARVGVALVALAPVLAWRRPDLLRPPPGAWPVLTAFGACVAAVNRAYYLAIDHLPVGVAVALQYTGPAMLVAATTLLARDAGSGGPGGSSLAPRSVGNPGRLAWAAAGLTLAGAVLVSRALEGLGALELPGLAAGLASAVLFAAYLLAAERAGRRGVEPATTLVWGFLVAVAIWAVAVPWWSWPVATLADPAVAALITRTAPTARANGTRVPTRPTPTTAAATRGSARVDSGHDHQGTATAQMPTATPNPHSRVVAGSAPRRPACSAASR